MSTSMNVAPRCACAHHADGSVTTYLCPMHADVDPCLTMSQITGRRRTGTIRNGVCTSCGHGSEVAANTTDSPRNSEAPPVFHIGVNEYSRHVTVCPVCGSLDTVVEVDVAVRWNTLALSDSGETATASTGQADFDFDHWECSSCASYLTAPDDFEITEWY